MIKSCRIAPLFIVDSSHYTTDYRITITIHTSCIVSSMSLSIKRLRKNLLILVEIYMFVKLENMKSKSKNIHGLLTFGGTFYRY